MQWFTRWLAQRRLRHAPTEQQQARDLIAAVDRGGVPLNPARVNHIARGLGLEVSRHAAVEDTIARIRRALARSGG